MILNQTYTNCLLYIVDDGSCQTHKQKYRELKQKYASNKKVVFDENETNKHIGYSLNKGIQYLLDNNADYFTWISDDNTYYNNYVETLVSMKKDFAHSSWKSVNTIINKSRVVKSKYANYKNTGFHVF